MLLQEKKELSTLYEETDIQVKLEAQVESLVQELEDRKSLEQALRCKIQILEEQLAALSDNHRHENEEWKQKVDNLDKVHHAHLKQQIILFHEVMSNHNLEDTDIVGAQKEMMEVVAAKTEDINKYKDLAYALFQSTVDNKWNRMLKEHEASLEENNKNCNQRVKLELEIKKQYYKNYCLKLKKENLVLRKTLEERNPKLSLERYSQWQSKLKEAEISFNPDSVGNYDSGLNNNLMDLYEDMSKSKDCVLFLIEKVMYLKNLIKTKSQKCIFDKVEFLREFMRASKEIHIKQRTHLNKMFETDLAGEMLKIHQMFETEWVCEMFKFQESQVRELNNSKDSEMAKLQQEYTTQMADDSQLTFGLHNPELQKLQQSLEGYKSVTGFHRSISSTIHDSYSDSNWKKHREGRVQAVSLHNREIENLKKELESKYERLYEQIREHGTKDFNENESKSEIGYVFNFVRENYSYLPEDTVDEAGSDSEVDELNTAFMESSLLNAPEDTNNNSFEDKSFDKLFECDNLKLSTVNKAVEQAILERSISPPLETEHFDIMSGGIMAFNRSSTPKRFLSSYDISRLRSPDETKFFM